MLASGAVRTRQQDQKPVGRPHLQLLSASAIALNIWEMRSGCLAKANHLCQSFVECPCRVVALRDVGRAPGRNEAGKVCQAVGWVGAEVTTSRRRTCVQSRAGKQTRPGEIHPCLHWEEPI